MGPCIRGLVVCACGSTGRVTESINSLKRLVELDIFDFVLSFAGVSTIDTLVVPAINRFIENVFVYDMKFWTALEQSFGEDRHALNSSPVMLSFAETHIDTENKRQRVVDTRVLAYSNFKDGRPWGLDVYRCSCGATAHNMIFHPDGKQLHGKQWILTKMKYECLQCGTIRRHIPCPTWIKKADTGNFGRVSYQWPLSLSQRQDIGITH
ncbi:uncharacterized protein EDB93DRAFT_1096033 [Suillus bovinus]|uniref:uncharacterized protein n=1 Tax=Suillus bovinus TaxID=48563 RepID=UPI001B86C77C|nr:uncharacterized protein EDB93DRAFT_1096033 [Suillus bovinus]KAG2128359.1 hypothetical protein EDB93DRAFT_1096033 [Suillus bovinus]